LRNWGRKGRDGKFDEKFAEEVRERVRQRTRKPYNIEEVIDQDVSLDEISKAIKRLRRGKAVGVDNYMNEVFMYGGEKIEEATWRLCREIFHQEAYPETWARGLIFPIFKGGPIEDTYNPMKYRGITLLSVLGKLYAAVLNERVTEWIESRGILVEEQAGFRRNRSTVDQLFILTEMIKNASQETYICFIDIQKAYDRVWRDGLWEKLYEYGMKGKMWRVLKNIYDTVESSVLVNEGQSRFFDVDTGLRQGCLLSPILFAIYINGLADEINREKLGVKLIRYRDGTLGVLMFADDIALLADTKAKLRKLLDITYLYSLRWRFTFNYDKCAVVVFKSKVPQRKIKYGNCISECTCGNHWKLGEQLIKQVHSYKYLGVELDTKLTFCDFKKRIKEKARRNVSRIWYMGMYDGCLSVKATINLYQALVRSVLEYACEIWGDEIWDEGERVQREMGRRILRCNGKTTNEAVLGELGWWRLQARRDYCKLKYWIRILLMDDTRLVRNVYDMSRKTYLKKGNRNWCYSIHRLAMKYGLVDLWDDENIIHQGDATQLQKSWNTFIYKRVQEVEEKSWLDIINHKKKKPKLRTYKSFKSKLVLEPYLLSEHQKSARFILTSIRTGTNKLRVDTGRQKKPKKEPLEDRICTVCKCGAVEDEKHFVLDCKMFESLRIHMIEKIKAKTQNLYNLHMYSREERWQILMNPQSKKSEVTEPLKEFLKNAMKIRAQTLAVDGR